MKSYDPKTAAKVWDRVQGRDLLEQDGQAILNLIAQELTEAAVYQRLARKLPAAQSSQVRQMALQEQAHAACLKGIYTLITGRKALVPAPQAADDPAEILLRRCYGRKMRTLTQYEARVGDPQYGHIFQTMAIQEKDHCRRILEILGTMAK